MMKIKRQLIATLGLLVLLSACGAPSTTALTSTTSIAVEEPTPTATTPAATAEATTDAAMQTEAEPTDAGMPTDAATSTEATSTTVANSAATECEEGSRLFDHELLATEPVCIPNAPQRVIALDMASLEVLLLKEQQPVGTAEWILQEHPLLLPAYAEKLSTVDGLGYPAELETVVVLQPDLILAPADTIDIKLASDIAPVVVPDAAIYGDWKLGMQFWSEVMNTQELYADMEANYRARVAELQTALGTPEEMEVSVISASTYGLSLWMPDSPPGAILADVGLARPEAQSLTGDSAMSRYGEKQYVELSEERLDLADGDAVFYFTYAATDPEVASKESAFIESFEQKPLWQTLGAVKAGQSFFVGGHWWRSQTYLLANLVIDDLFTHLTDTAATTPVLSSTQ
jgi:iron complex transport system substrate-binding protein